MNKYSKQAIFLATNSISTEEDLIKYEKEVYSKISPLKSERVNLWRKHKRTKTD